jgi:hypothetical protein
MDIYPVILFDFDLIVDCYDGNIDQIIIITIAKV